LPTADQLALLHHRYAGEIQVIDANLARLLDAWQARYGDTGMVLITADHGEEFVEHGHLSHSLTVHREVVHVPLLIRLPEGTLPPEHATGWVEPAVSHIDLVPTTLELLGIDPRQVDEGPALQGTSWLSWLRGQSEAPHRPIVASHSRFGRRIYRYREANLVFIKEMFYDGRPTQLYLYDLDKDPTEQTNLIGERDVIARGVETRCDSLAVALREAYDPTTPSANRADETTLRALGYIQ
jgi:arylsulfatase A-like enzyme